VVTDAITARRLPNLCLIHQVIIDGANFNGIIIMARKLGAELNEPPVGHFTLVPPSLVTYGCGRRSGPNIAASKDTKDKSSVEVKWKAPSEDIGPIYFKATVVRSKYYWNDTFTPPIVFNHFPPSMAKCGVDQFCYRYSGKHSDCTPDTCDYILIAHSGQNDVEFTIGAKLDTPAGYSGVGFTSDMNKLSHMDICACRKNGTVIDPAHYFLEDLSQTPVKQNEFLIDEQFDVDGSTVWCQFRRPKRLPERDAADLNQYQYLVFLWGPLSDNDGSPVLGSMKNLQSLVEPWSRNRIETIMCQGSGARACANVASLTLMVCLLLIGHLLSSS